MGIMQMMTFNLHFYAVAILTLLHRGYRLRRGHRCSIVIAVVGLSHAPFSHRLAQT